MYAWVRFPRVSPALNMQVLTVAKLSRAASFLRVDQTAPLILITNEALPVNKCTAESSESDISPVRDHHQSPPLSFCGITPGQCRLGFHSLWLIKMTWVPLSSPLPCYLIYQVSGIVFGLFLKLDV